MKVNRNYRYRACEEDSGKQGKIRSTQVLLFHSVSKENKDCRYIACEVDNEKKWKKNNDSSIVISCHLETKLKTKQEKKLSTQSLRK